MKLRVLFILNLLYCQVHADSPQPIFYLNFDDFNIEEIIINEDSAYYIEDLQQPKYVAGLNGRALDLSANAVLRKPVKLDKSVLPTFGEHASFTVQIWVKTLTNAHMGTPIIGNKIANDFTTSGWQIYTQTNGAWALILNDGETRYEYKPTAERQRINDGHWHQIVFTVQRDTHEVWMYLDGENVAIYNTPDLRDLESGFSTVVGGSDEKWEYGSYAQWNAFNGIIDEVKIWNEVLSTEEVRKQYTQFFPDGEMSGKRLNPSHINVLSWNIWHGGNRYGQAVGLQRVIETIKSADPDILGLVETYGSGEIIADSLGYYFYLISSNLSILSRYPITETIKAFNPFNFGGVKLALSDSRKLIFFNTWLNYLPDVDASIRQENKSPEVLIKDESNTRHAEIKEILRRIHRYTEDAENLPIIMAGDFNIGSHLDWTAETKDIHYNRIVEWPVSKEMQKVGFLDSYRALHINPLTDPGLTWGIRAATTTELYGLRDRIDFIYYKGGSLYPIESRVIDYHPVMFPSDHAAISTVFQLKK